MTAKSEGPHCILLDIAFLLGICNSIIFSVNCYVTCHTCIVWRRQEFYKRGWVLWRAKRNFGDHAPFEAWSRHLHSRQLHTSSLGESLGSAWFTLLFKNLSRVWDFSWLFVHLIWKPFVGCTMKKKIFEIYLFYIY